MPRLRIEQTWRAIITRQRTDRTAVFIRRTLSVAAILFGALVRLRFWMYERGLLRRSWPGCLVISIGNITVGGTGKTPIVELFARALAAGGRKVAIISRGYKARSPSWRWRWRTRHFLKGTLVVHDGTNLLLGARLAGDEPYMLARNLGNVVVITDHDRVRGSRYAIRQFGVDTILLDDGMQHIRLQRQIEVVLIDATCPFGHNALLPRGLLREPEAGLRRATHIFITKAEDIELEPIRARIRQVNPTAEIITCFYAPVELVNLHSGAHLPLTELRDQNVFIMTGIAQPDGFVSQVKKLGAIVQRVYLYPDHHRFSSAEIEHVFQRARNWHADAIVVTEKDAVRFSSRVGTQALPCPVYYLKIAVTLGLGAQDFTNCVLRICYP